MVPLQALIDLALEACVTQLNLVHAIDRRAGDVLAYRLGSHLAQRFHVLAQDPTLMVDVRALMLARKPDRAAVLGAMTRLRLALQHAEQRAA